MMTDYEFQQWCKENQLSESAIAHITRIRNSDPSRLVAGGKHNVAGRFASKKMGLTIQSESRHVELAFIYLLEHDNRVKEYLDQALKIKLTLCSSKGKVFSIEHTPDFFVAWLDKAGYYECKTEEKLDELSQKEPNRYIKENGVWRCPPGEVAAAQFGLTYSVISSADIDLNLVANLKFLQDYIYDSEKELPVEECADIMTFVKENPAVLLRRLITECKFDSDVIYYMIARKLLFVDYYKCNVSQPDFCHVFTHVESSMAYHNIIENRKPSLHNESIFYDRVGEELLWSGKSWRIINRGDDEIFLLSKEGSISLPKDAFYDLVKKGDIKSSVNNRDELNASWAMSRLSAASKKELAIALRRFEIIRPVLFRNESIRNIQIPGITQRTIYNWVSSYKKAEQTYGFGFIGLLPEQQKKGNRTARISDEIISLANEFLDEQLNYTDKTKELLYVQLAEEFERKGFFRPSRKLFGRILSKRNKYETVKKTLGDRAAYQVKHFYTLIDQTTPRHGVRPFEYVHIDHTPLDVELVDSSTGKNLGKAWLSLMLDAFTRRVLAFCISFDSPSINSLVLLFQECVRRFNRLPSTVITDNGKEFKSVYFQSFLAFYGVNVMYRPPHESRFGCVGERYFGTVMHQLIWNLRGNTKATKTPRQVTKSNDPKNLAIWTLPELWKLLESFMYDYYDQREHPALGESPREAFTRTLDITGKREMRYIPYNDDFKVMSLPSAGTRKIDSQRGVHVNGYNYNSEVLSNANLDGKIVEVRYNPWDIGVVYCYLQNHWVKCYSEHHYIFQGRSLKEIRIASQELMQRKVNYNSAENNVIRAKALAKFFDEVEVSEERLAQRLKDMELSTVLFERGLGMGSTLHTHQKPHNDIGYVKPNFDGETLEKGKGRGKDYASGARYE